MALYIGTYTGGESRGIYRYDGARMTLAAALDNPSYLIFSRSGKRAYAVSETKTFRGRSGGAAASFDVLEDGALRLTSLAPTLGADPCHLCLSAGEDALFVANYGAGSLSRFSLDAQGRLCGGPQLAQHAGRGPNPARQEGPHVHFAALCPARPDLLWAADLGLDAIFAYDTAPGGPRAPLARLALPAGCGPRHIAFHPRLALAYVICELANCIVTVRVGSDGLPAGIAGACSTRADGAQGPSIAAAIRLDADGRHLYASNRGDDSVAVYAVDEQGALCPRGVFPTGGRSPRDIALTPDGGALLCAHQDGGGVTRLMRDAHTGLLGEPQPFLAADSPVCLQFSP